MTVSVKEILPLSAKGNLKALAVVEVGPWTIRGLRIIQQPGQRPFVSLPQEQTSDGRYFPLITTRDRNLKEEVQAAVLGEWNREDEHRTL